jgi:hypothetical protein
VKELTVSVGREGGSERVEHGCYLNVRERAGVVYVVLLEVPPRELLA